ncbi:hypothetical protein [Falsiroseomonas selenitidurans]|uniref:Uncharacterized protein n=1 Tax=Falsiroseomonas selenitidurans TaxID=2716335 RepID=A0ABX1ECM0_9PROT|nr:hypothetical protein [Falsiroseomonas selenitidurans]NKC32635.1 hypothetical protein [Falsiroseomonas selenitidurans]
MTVTATTPTATPSRAAQDILPPLGPDEHVPVPGTLTFGEFVSALNPLQHVPVVGTIYRAMTGDTLAPPLRVLGAAAFGGPLGMLSAAAFAAIEEVGRAGTSGRA